MIHPEPEEIAILDEIAQHDRDKPLRGSVESVDWHHRRNALVQKLNRMHRTITEARGNSGFC